MAELPFTLSLNRQYGIDYQRGSVWYAGQEYFAKVGAYSKGQMALRLEAKSSEAFKPGARAVDYPPIRVTWNMGNYIGRERPMPKNASFLNVPEFPGIEDFVLKTGLAKPVLKNGEQVVRCNKANNEWYPAYQFDERALRALDNEGYERYSNSYDKQAAEEERLKNLRMARRYGSCPIKETFDEPIRDDAQF